MKNIKLYTEDEVRELLRIAFWQDFESADTAEEDIINEANYIELPSNDEINESSYKYTLDKFGEVEAFADAQYGFIDGVKWVIEQIKKQSNGRKPTVEITRAHAILLIKNMLRTSSSKELEDCIAVLRYDTPELPYYGFEFIITD